MIEMYYLLLYYIILLFSFYILAGSFFDSPGLTYSSLGIFLFADQVFGRIIRTARSP